MKQLIDGRIVTAPRETDGCDSSVPALKERFEKTREFSLRIAKPLSPEDCSIQSMEDASPTRWHLAHTTWFFETFLLKPRENYRPFDESFEYLFNSYYNTIGRQFPRNQRGLISRPDLNATLAYRTAIDQRMFELFEEDILTDQQIEVLEIGLNHEQQHQELMLTDIKHALAQNPLDLACYGNAARTLTESIPQDWLEFDASIVEVGYAGDGFSFDNERPRHRVFLEPFRIAQRCVTNGEYLEFIEDGGYSRPEFWLSPGWSTVDEHDWNAPLYWQKDETGWSQFTLAGRKPVDVNEPVCHVSYFEADAFARWAGRRLATEFEWEHTVCATTQNPYGSDHPGHWSDHSIAKGQTVHPRVESDPRDHEFGGVADNVGELTGAMGNLWQWTGSHYSAYPGYDPPRGALGEYNGKFMCNVFVLRGGSCASPSGHVRPTYRNFFSPQSRWQFTGIRLAESC